MAVINSAVARAMVKQLGRVNDKVDAVDVYQQLADARAEIRRLQRLVEQLQIGHVAPIAGLHGALTTPARFAAMHNLSISTVNRALNAGTLKGERQPNGRWLVYEDQGYTRKRGH